MVTQIAVINFIPGGVPPHVKVSQGDTQERVLQFQCYFGDASYSIPSGSTVIVNGAKPGGTVFTRSATFSGNVVTLPCAEGMTDTAGKIPCEIMVTTSSGTISSANFVLEVEGAPANDAAVSASDLSAMTEMIETAIEKAGEAATSATSAAGSASQAAATLASTVKYSDIVNTGTVTATGTKAMDAVQNNPNVNGTLAAKIAKLGLPVYYYAPDSTKTLLENYLEARTQYGTESMIIYMMTGFIGTSSVLAQSLPTQNGIIRITQHGASNERTTAEFLCYSQHLYAKTYIYNGAIGTWSITGGVVIGSESSVSVPSDTFTLLSSVTLPAGTYVVTGSCSFGGNSTGYREIQISAGTPTNHARYGTTAVGFSGASNILNNTRILILNSETTLGLYGFQTSGGSLTCYPALSAVRIK